MRIALIVATVVLSGLASTRGAEAHCDAMNGPVVAAARRALDAGDPAAALAWVKPEQEAAVRGAFQKAIAARKQGDAAREIADLWFFETLVRLHRAGEGAPFTGLKPAAPAPAGIAMADKAIQQRDIKELRRHVTSAVSGAIDQRWKALQAVKPAPGDVAAGRRWVDEYVAFVHLVQGIVGAAEGEHGEHGEHQEK